MVSEEILSQFRNIFEKELIDEISESGSVNSIKAGDSIIEPGNYIKFIPVIVSGLLKVMRRDDEGNEILLYYIGKGETCAMSLHCCVAQSKSDILAIAEEDTVLLSIPVIKMEEWNRKYSSWSRFVMQAYNTRFTEILLAIDGIAFKKVDERLEQYLINLSELTKSQILEVGHQQIADELHSSREVISRLLKIMENNGRIKMGRNKIELLPITNSSVKEK
jgi:CRP/FNR family transcriptional regulator, anaerobic regulatory protein